MTTNGNRMGERKAAAASDRLREHTRLTEEIIRSLKRELSVCRDENQTLAKERNDLLRLLSRAQAPKERLDELENESNFLEKERGRLAGALSAIGDEHGRCRARCVSLEEALARERAEIEKARDVIIYLEAQIVQLEEMVELLREHKELSERAGR